MSDVNEMKGSEKMFNYINCVIKAISDAYIYKVLYKYVAESTTTLGGAIVVNVATVLRHKLRN